MPICVKCGMKIPVGRYCGGCGIRVAESASHSGEQPSLNSGNDLNSPPKPESVEEEINRLTADLKLFPSSIDTYLKLSEALLIAGKLDRAFSTIRAFKALFPDDPRGHKIAGKILETLDRKEEAIKSFEKSLEKDSSDIQTVLHVVELLHGIGRTREALSKLQPLRHFSQKHPIILLKMAEIEVSQGNPSIAREYLSEFRKYAGETLEMFALLGRTMILQSFFDGAVRLFQEGLSRFPNDPELHLGLGKSFIGLNQREKAVVELENALRNSPGNPEILLEIGRLHGIMGLYEKSEEMFSRIRNNPATLGAIFLELGKFYLSQTMRDQAIIELKHARELSPHHPEISRILGETLETAQENSQALGIYDSFLSFHPGTDWALAGIIRTSGNLGDFRRVANAQQSLIDLGNKTTDAWCDLGETLIRLNLFDDAGKAFEKASQIDPSCARAYQAPELIRIEKARSKGEKLFKDAKDAAAKKLFLTAVESLEHALELVPREITWMRFLADLCLRIGEITRAGELLSKVRVSNPGDFWVNFQLARVYEFEEKPQLALELLSSTLKDHPKEIEAHIMLLRLKRAQIPKDRLDKELITSFILKSRSDFLKMPKSEPLPLLVDGFTHYLLGGFSKFQAESLKKAEECFEEALSRFQDSIWAHRGLSLVFRVRGDFKLASKHIHEIVKLSSDPCLLYSLARFCENFQNFGEAKKYYASLRNLFPENGAFRKKVIEMIGREPAEGNKNPLLDFLTNCQETLRSTPNHVWTLFDVAFAQSLFAHGSQQKDEWNKRSMLTWNKVISQPDSPPWAWWNLIAAQRNSLKAGAERNRILNQHLSTCEKLVRDFPNVAEAHLALGESYLAFNDLAQTDKAVKHLEIAAFLEPESAEILHVLALSNRALGKSIRVDAIRDNMILLEPEFSARF